jgi:hypothetical protein
VVAGRRQRCRRQGRSGRRPAARIPRDRPAGILRQRGPASPPPDHLVAQSPPGREPSAPAPLVTELLRIPHAYPDDTLVNQIRVSP